MLQHRPPQPAPVTLCVTNPPAAAADRARRRHFAPCIPHSSIATAPPSPRSHAHPAVRAGPRRPSAPAAGPGRSPAPAPAVPPAARRRRRCNSPHIRTAMQRQMAKPSPCPPCAHAANGLRSRAAPPPAPACRKRRAGTRDTPPAESGSCDTGSPQPAGHTRVFSAATAESVHPRRRRGSSSARAALSRNFAANSAVDPSCRCTSSPLRRAPAAARQPSGASSASGKRSTNPSSVHIVSTSGPPLPRILAAAAIAHGA